MEQLRLFWLFVKTSVLNDTEYRADFFAQIVVTLLGIGTQLVAVGVIFRHTPNLAGWSLPQVLGLLGVYNFMYGFIGAVIAPNMRRVLEDVQQGTLDYALTKPEDAQLLVSVRQVRIWQLVEVVSGLVLLLVGLAGVQASVGVDDSFAFAAALVLGASMVYCFWLVVTTVAFWVVRMEHVLELFEGVYQTGRWPIGVYPGWLRYGITFLVPVGFAVTVPAEALTSRLHALTLLGAAAFAAGLFAVTRWFWRYGLRHYSGASA